MIPRPTQYVFHDFDLEAPHVGATRLALDAFSSSLSLFFFSRARPGNSGISNIPLVPPSTLSCTVSNPPQPLAPRGDPPSPGIMGAWAPSNLRSIPRFQLILIEHGACNLYPYHPSNLCHLHSTCVSPPRYCHCC